MLQYSEKEAKLQAWKKKLEQTQTAREKRKIIKNELLAIINDPTADVDLRYDNFMKMREQLLGDNHNLGLTWAPHFSRFWSFLALFFSRFKNYGGSRLRRALKEDVIIPPFESNPPDKNKTFEEVLFTNPALAFAELKMHFMEINTQKPIVLLERLYALKYIIPSETYQKYLTILFNRNPLESMRFFYNCYLENHRKLEDQNFVEHGLLSRALVDYFVISSSTEINPQIDNFYALFFLIGLTKKGDPLKDLLANDNPFDYLDPVYQNHRETIKNRWKDEEELFIQFSYSSNDKKTSSRIDELKKLVTQEKFSLSNNPLLIHIGHYACQYFFRIFKEKKTFVANEPLHLVLEFLSQKILQTPVKFLRDIEFETYKNILNIIPIRFPQGYQTAISFSSQILTAAFFSENLALIKAQDMASKQKLTSQELYWTMGVFSCHFNKDFINKVEKILSSNPVTPKREETSYNINPFIEPALSFNPSINA